MLAAGGADHVANTVDVGTCLGAGDGLREREALHAADGYVGTRWNTDDSKV